MPITIPSQFYANIIIDGDEFPLNTNKSTRIYVNTNTKTLLPVTRCFLPDFGNFFGRRVPVNDGSKINITINDGSSQNNNQVIKFSCFGTPKRIPTRDFNNYLMLGLLDAVPFVRATVNQAIKGTSAEVMQKIASTIGLNLVSDISTNDQMTWRAGRQHWGNFMVKVAKHGYIDDQSLTHAAVDEQHNLHYHNITDIFASGEIKAVLYYGAGNSAPAGLAPKVFECLQTKGINRSGMLNNHRGYGLRTSQTNPISGEVNTFTTVVAQKVSNNLDINTQLLNAISPYAKIELPPLFMGNTYDNYIKARHQNSRLISTYSQNIYVTVPKSTGLTIYDLVQFNSNSTAWGQDYSVSGFYIVTAITRCFLGQRYIEKIELTGSGPQADNSSLV